MTLSGRRILDRDPANPDFRDSGAIIVTAASSTAPHTRLAYGPHGRRIDCYAWGQNINTLSSDSAGSTTAYTTGFGGTSGASPIITGAALAVQGRAQAQLGFRFSPRQMRALLSNPATGTAPAATETTADRRDAEPARDLSTSVLNVAPDVYMRDFVGDSGEPHTGAISASPDIILRPVAVATRRPPSVTAAARENSADARRSWRRPGRTTSSMCACCNRAARAATNVDGDGLLVASRDAGDAGPLDTGRQRRIPSVPVGELLTVSDAIVWAAGAASQDLVTTASSG